MTSKKKLLLISYRFAPEASAGSIRSIKFAKYLPQFDWHTTVLTVSNPPQDSLDQSTLDELPENTQIIKAPRLEPSSINRYIEKHAHQKLKGLGWRIASLLDSILYPDFSAIWQFFAFFKGLYLCTFNKYDAIYSTYAPASNHLVAMLLSKIFSIPWAADYRDLWVHDFEYHPRNKLRKFCDRNLERMFIKSSSVVITTSTGLTNIMKREYANYKNKIITIPNGFDPADAPQKSTTKQKNTIIFSHVGTLYSSRSIDHILLALDKALESEQNENFKVVFKLVGNVHIKIAKPSSFSLVYTGWKNRAEAIQEIADSDVCVLPLHNKKGGNLPVPQKLYEYLAFGRKVLATGQGNCFAAEILDRAENGYFIEQDNSNELICCINEILLNHKDNNIEHIEANTENISAFSRIHLSEQLSKVLNHLENEELIKEFDFKPL